MASKRTRVAFIQQNPTEGSPFSYTRRTKSMLVPRGIKVGDEVVYTSSPLPAPQVKVIGRVVALAEFITEPPSPMRAIIGRLTRPEDIGDV